MTRVYYSHSKVLSEYQAIVKGTFKLLKTPSDIIKSIATYAEQFGFQIFDFNSQNPCCYIVSQQKEPGSVALVEGLSTLHGGIEIQCFTIEQLLNTLEMLKTNPEIGDENKIMRISEINKCRTDFHLFDEIAGLLHKQPKSADDKFIYLLDLSLILNRCITDTLNKAEHLDYVCLVPATDRLPLITSINDLI